MTVEMTTIDYLVYMGASFIFGASSTLFIWFIYLEAKRQIIKEAKEKVRD